MQQSSDKENRKVQTDKQFKDNEVHEGNADNSIYKDGNNESANPFKDVKSKQNKDQEEYSDRNNDKR